MIFTCVLLLRNRRVFDLVVNIMYLVVNESLVMVKLSIRLTVVAVESRHILH